MSKIKLNELSREQLINLQKQLEQEIENLNKVIVASNTTVFDLLINEVKKEMQDNIAEEEWKKLKENQKKIESYRSIEKTLQNQEDLLERKQEELEDIEEALAYYQTSIFELEARFTTYQTKDGENIRTGDVYESQNEDGSFDFCMVKEADEDSSKFVIISTMNSEDLGVQYPKNREILDNAKYVGNVYISEECQGKEALERATFGLNQILCSREESESDS
jgi:hypothetical protein